MYYLLLQSSFIPEMYYRSLVQRQKYYLLLQSSFIPETYYLLLQSSFSPEIDVISLVTVFV